MRSSFEHSGYTGGLAEEEVFGKPNNTLSHQEFLQAETARKIEGRRRPELETLFEQVRSIQPRGILQLGELRLEKGPTNPQKYFAGALRKTLAEELKWPNEYVHFNTAINTELDYAYGIDAFIDIVARDENGKERVLHTITLDITKREGKVDSRYGKADVIFVHKELDPKDDKEEFMKYVQDVAHKCILSLPHEIKGEESVNERPLADAA